MTVQQFCGTGRCIAVLFFLSALLVPAHAVTFHPPIPYVQAGDADGVFNTTWPIGIEDFEDNSVDPFISEITGAILPPNFSSGTDNLTDSVDGDDGAVDGNGNGGWSFFNSGRSVHITFQDPVTTAGLVWTDGDPASSGVMLEAFDAGGLSLGVFDYGDLGDSEITGEAAEDRFLGVTDAGGIGSLLVTNLPGGSGIEIDHIQWHAAVPEPAGVAMLAFGLLGLIGWRRQR